MDRNRLRRLFILILAQVVMLVVFFYAPPEQSDALPRAGLENRVEAGGIAKEDFSINLSAANDHDSSAALEEPDPERVKESGEAAASGVDGAELREPGQSASDLLKEKHKPAPNAVTAPGSQGGEAPENQPVPAPEPEAPLAQAPKEEAPAPAAPVTYVWRGAHQVTFSSQVHLTNTGSERAQNVWVDIPMLENSSPYQETRLQSTNYELAYMTGRVGSFGIGSIEPGETVVITTNYSITIRPVSIKSSNETVEKARQAYQQFAGSGNCFQLASGFVGRCREMGLNARLVNGFARSHGNIAPGSLEGWRHSWAEFHVDGLGWVPVDLTFKYFADFPYASHVVETYADQSVKVYYLGGKISVKWQNMIL